MTKAKKKKAHPRKVKNVSRETSKQTKASQKRVARATAKNQQRKANAKRQQAEFARRYPDKYAERERERERQAELERRYQEKAERERQKKREKRKKKIEDRERRRGGDWQRLYTIKNGNVFMFGYRDFSGELSLSDIMESVQGIPADMLLIRLRHLNDMECTYSPNERNSKSSGYAGECKFMRRGSATTAMQAINSERRKENDWEKVWKEHKGNRDKQYSRFAWLTDALGNPYFHALTGLGILQIAVAFMEHVVEDNRKFFYAKLYPEVIKEIQWLKRFFPEPR